MSKKLYLHIGCGKTGSSALQIWLANNAEKLIELGICYPIYGASKLNEYSITSGNGVKLFNAAKNNTAREFLENQFKTNDQTTLFSSEAFQELSDSELLTIKNAAESNGFELNIIAYVRDAYDMAYSSYLQLIKRHLLTQSFKEFGTTRTSLQQFTVIEKYKRNIDRRIVFHYETEKKRGLEVSFCEALSIDRKNMPSMTPTKVNRSLTIFESELMRAANKAYTEHCSTPDQGFSRFISDKIIYTSPEKPTETLYDIDVLNHFERMMRKHVDELNHNYFPDSRLKIFNQEGRHLISTLPTIEMDYKVVIETLIEFFQKISTTSKPTLPEPTKKEPAPESTSSKNMVVKYLTQSAASLEKSDLLQAQIMMRAAAAIRPEGPVIKAKLELYEKLLDARANSTAPSLATENQR
jgi:hypothetical protein